MAEQSADLSEDAQLLQHVPQQLLVVVHAGVNDGPDGLVHKLAEATLALVAAGLLLRPSCKTQSHPLQP